VFPEQGNIASVLPTYLTKWTTTKLNEMGVETKPLVEVTGAKLDSSQSVVLSLSNGEDITAVL
jgi:programmed cell death 8 (apoptosis-inducing factor)